MKRTATLLIAGTLSMAATLGSVAFALSAQDKSAQDTYALKVPGGLAFSEFKGYESWQVVSVSEDGGLLAVVVANPTMIEAFRSGIPGNGKPFPNGSKMAKVHWETKKLETFPAATVPARQHDVDFMVKDSRRFADSGGWGYAVFDRDKTSGTFSPGTQASNPPQGNDARCGYACHTVVKARDYVFTEFAER